MTCPLCGCRTPRGALICDACGAPLSPDLSLARTQGKGDGGPRGQASPTSLARDIHAARTLLVPEDMLEELRLQPSEDPRYYMRKSRSSELSVSKQGPAGSEELEPPPVPVPPGEPGPWQIPTDHPRPIRLMRRSKTADQPIEVHLPEPQDKAAKEGCPVQSEGAGRDPGVRKARPRVTQGPEAPKNEELLGEVTGARLIVEDFAGQVLQEIELPMGLARLGRREGEVLFTEDPYMAPMHAWLYISKSGAWTHDPGSSNGVYVHRTMETLLESGDALIVGSQLLLFRDRWGLRGTREEGTQLFGSAGWANPLRLVNLRMGGDVVFIHTLDGDLVIGRAGASPYRNDRYLARRHLSVELTAEGVLVRDISGGRGYFLRIRKECWLSDGQAFIIGSRLLRIRLRRGH